MSPLVSLLRSLARSGSPTSSPWRRREARRRLWLEALEDRSVPSATISVANASLNEIGNVSPFVASGSGGLSNPSEASLLIGPDGNLYVGSIGTNSVIRYNPAGQLLGTFVTLSAPFAEPVTVNYDTADGTAVAGTNYTATSGTLTFPAGITTQGDRIKLHPFSRRR